jgi:ubiquinone/menaquinone biosynthesis C-methylase UbiE
MDSNSLRSAQIYWNTAAETYAERFTATTVGVARRKAVWRDLERVFHPGDRILELNCGTGIDAVFLAEKGIRVLGCDIAPRMIELARERAAEAKLQKWIDFRVLPTENISALRNEGPFDGAFSNFSGLNCVEDLTWVSRDLGALLRPGAPFLTCMMGRFVPWEIAWFLAHGRPNRAFMRLCGSSTHYSTAAELSAHRPSVQQIREQMKADFTLRGWKGIGITVPPSYMEHWARRVPKLIDWLSQIDEGIGGLPIFRSMADGVLMEFERGREIHCNAAGA